MGGRSSIDWGTAPVADEIGSNVRSRPYYATFWTAGTLGIRGRHAAVRTFASRLTASTYSRIADTSSAFAEIFGTLYLTQHDWLEMTYVIALHPASL